MVTMRAALAKPKVRRVDGRYWIAIGHACKFVPMTRAALEAEITARQLETRTIDGKLFVGETAITRLRVEHGRPAIDRDRWKRDAAMPLNDAPREKRLYEYRKEQGVLPWGRR